jgi:hypothetical protein
LGKFSKNNSSTEQMRSNVAGIFVYSLLFNPLFQMIMFLDKWHILQGISSSSSLLVLSGFRFAFNIAHTSDR